MSHTGTSKGVDLTRWHRFRREYHYATHHSAGEHVAHVEFLWECVRSPEKTGGHVTGRELADELRHLSRKLHVDAAPMRFLCGDALSPTRVSLEASKLAAGVGSRGVTRPLPDVFIVPSAAAWTFPALLAPARPGDSPRRPCRVDEYEVRGVERLSPCSDDAGDDPTWPSVAARIERPAEWIELVLDLAPRARPGSDLQPTTIDLALRAAQHIRVRVAPRADGSARCSIVLPSSSWRNLPLAFDAREEERRAAAVYCRLFERALDAVDAAVAACESERDARVGRHDAALDARLTTLVGLLDAQNERYSRFRYATRDPAPETLDALLSTCADELLRERWPHQLPNAPAPHAVMAPSSAVRIDTATVDRLHAIFRWVRIARVLSGATSPLTIGGSVLEGAHDRQLDVWFRSNDFATGWWADDALRAAADESRDCGGCFDAQITAREVTVRFTLPLP